MNEVAIADTGLKSRTIDQIIDVFSQFPEIEKATLYGSRAMGTYRRGSDIDLTLEGDKLSYTLLNKIDIALDNLFLPYTFDLSILHKIKNEELKDHINRVGKVFYSRI